MGMDVWRMPWIAWINDEHAWWECGLYTVFFMSIGCVWCEWRKNDLQKDEWKYNHLEWTLGPLAFVVHVACWSEWEIWPRNIQKMNVYEEDGHCQSDQAMSWLDRSPSTRNEFGLGMAYRPDSEIICRAGQSQLFIGSSLDHRSDRRSNQPILTVHKNSRVGHSNRRSNRPAHWIADQTSVLQNAQ